VKKILLALVWMISICAFARVPFISGADLENTSQAHDVSDAKSGGGGEDQYREVLSVQVTDASGQAAGAKCTLTNDKGTCR